ncbi:MAG: pyruvate carboxylase [Myxococcota bacterium]
MTNVRRPIRKLLCANRGEIAIRVFRAATELGLRTVAIHSWQDRVALHRYKADEGYLVGRGRTPVQAYLAVDEIIEVARRAGVDAIHPGYGFLSERADFSRACADAGIIFVGPPPAVLEALGDKTAARDLAVREGVPIVPGSGPVTSAEDAHAFVTEIGFPVIIKAAMGGGGRGMRVVRDAGELETALTRARSEAEAAFGDGTVFIERFVDHPRHIEVQILADAAGDVMHLNERDCSVQRRHQKVVEIAPAPNLDDETRQRLYDDAIRIARGVGYRNAGTVEFLLGGDGRHYFIEANPRIQVEHTVTEQVTMIDLVQSQIRIAGGATFEDLGLSQLSVEVKGAAIQCRVTTEDPAEGFQPGTGKLEVFRSGAGMGIRLDGGAGYSGAVISPDYDSMLVKVTGHAIDFESAAQKVHRALAEFRIRGVPTNIPFLQNVLTHPRFLGGRLDTRFIDETPELFEFPVRRNRAQRLLRYFGELAVNGPRVPGMQAGVKPSPHPPVLPSVDVTAPPPTGWRDVLQRRGPEEFARTVRRHKGVLVTDTTWRDAHQSLLATRVRTADLVAIAPATARLFAPLLSLEMWGGATFDVAMRFLRECPWDRLDRLREHVPNIPFQMLLRGANAVGYTNYPDNVVRRFCRAAHDHGLDIFRIFDALNYLENMKLGIDAVGEAGGVIEACICYTGDVADPGRTKYSLQYYLDRAGELVDHGIHILAVKDMAGLLKPPAARLLTRALRRAFPEVPIVVHTHDTAGTGVASMLACAEEDVDAVDLALPAMAGLTSQPTMAAILAALQGTERALDLDDASLGALNAYWESARGLYAPFETGLTGYAPDLYQHEIPGGQYTNLRFQAAALGLLDRWASIKRAYAAANRLLGDVIKVTPTSKVVGDLAQFMVQNDLDEEQARADAATLSFPQSVVDFMAGRLGQPHGGFPEPFRTHVLKGAPRMERRAGASMAPLDFDALRADLELRHAAEGPVRDVDVVSAALYPGVFEEFQAFRREYSDVSMVPTRHFLAAPAVNEEFLVEIERGKTLVVKLTAVGPLDHEGCRTAFFELNGQPRRVRVRDEAVEAAVEVRPKADPKNDREVGAPMPGTVIELRVRDGDRVEAGDPLLVLSAMKMETVVGAPVPGRVASIAVDEGDIIAPGDLLLELV